MTILTSTPDLPDSTLCVVMAMGVVMWVDYLAGGECAAPDLSRYLVLIGLCH
jgi:hypothetical protein